MIDVAIEKAKMLPVIRGRQRVYTIITDKAGRVISEAANSYDKTHPKQKRYSLLAGCSEHKIYLHSELRALIAAKGNEHHMYIARVGADGKQLPAFPCAACKIAISESNVKTVECTV